MASGSISADKVRRMAAWLARHEVDLSSEDAQAYVAGTRDRPTPGQVAWLLWGGDIGSGQRDRARRWAERKRDQLINEGELSKAISATVRDGLKVKVAEHNESVGNARGKRVTLSMLAQVYERGIGAYQTNPSSVRPNVKSPEQWAYARVNAFLGAVRSGRYKSGQFDTDLLPEGHPLSTRKTTKETDVNEIEKATKREDGEDFPAQAFAYVPDSESPSTWKLRLWDSLTDRETAAQVGRAIAALGPGGFRGNRVQIPTSDLSRVKARVLAAWVRTHPDMTEDDAPDVLKGWGYEMKDDDEGESYDPLDSLLNAYSAAVKLGPVTDELLGKIMAVITDVREMYTEDSMPEMSMSKNGGYTNPVMCLVHAYLGLLNTSRADLRAAVMELIHEAEAVVYGGEREGAETGDMGDQGGSDMESPDGVSDSSTPVQRVVRQEGEQYCVYSTTGRSFGCYQTETDALARLAQIEQFSAAKLASASLTSLVEWHDRCHQSTTVTPALKLVHDVIEDELELRGHARPYDLTLDDKINLMTEKASGVVAKADEQRYTLGPWYVPGVEDAHGEFTDDDTLQTALWDWVRKGDRTIYLQHGDKAAGEMVEILTVPFPVEADLTVPGQGTTRYQFPANTPFMGVVWEPWAWDLVKAGRLRGYSIGGTARRMVADLPSGALV